MAVCWRARHGNQLTLTTLASTIELKPNTVQVWHIPLAHDRPSISALYKQLDQEEKARADKFHHANSKQRYIAAHYAVRSILADHLQVAPANLKLTTTGFNKPVLKPGEYSSDIRFNLTHCAKLALLAITLDHEVGIDLEHMSIHRKIAPLTRRYFSDTTVAAIEKLSGTNQKAAFLRAWTQFEAFKKAQGTGLRGGDDKLEFALEDFAADQFRPLLLNSKPDNWVVANLAAGPEWIAALVLDSNDLSVQIENCDYQPIISR